MTINFYSKSYSLFRTSKSTNLKDSAFESLEKQLRDKDNSFKKERALLSQKIELLELQLKDSIEREESTKRLHDTMLNAFKQDTQEGKKNNKTFAISNKISD